MEVALTIAANLASTAAVLCAAWLALKEREGWGWFLFVAILLSGPAARVAVS